MMTNILIRPARASDSADIIRIVGACFDLYPGCVLDLDDLDKELPDFANHFKKAGGEAFVALDGQRVVGCVGWTPHKDGGVELKRLYVDPAFHGNGAGDQLTQKVLLAAKKHQAPYIDLWSDTRFKTAHQFYERRGWVRQSKTRDLNDLSNTTEYHYVLKIRD